MDAARKRATIADLQALPPDARAELIEGAIVHLPPLLPEHGRGQRAIGRFIGGPFDDDEGRGGPGGGANAMNVWKPIALVAVAGLVASIGMQVAHAGQHPNLNKALSDMTNAVMHLANTQVSNEFDMDGHAQKAKDLVTQAEGEVRAAIQAANKNGR